jgi:hypothetical protein
VAKKVEKKKVIQFVTNTPMLAQIGCKLKWTSFLEHTS